MAAAKDTGSVDQETLADLVKSVRDIAEAGKATRQLTVMEIDHVTPWNPEGKRNRKRLRVPCYQNGARVEQDRCTEEEIELFNKIRPGRYNERRWEVVQRRDKSLDLRYSNKKIEDRFRLAADAGGLGLVGILQSIVTEMAQKKAKKDAHEVLPEDETYYN